MAFFETRKGEQYTELRAERGYIKVAVEADERL